MCHFYEMPSEDYGFYPIVKTFSIHYSIRNISEQLKKDLFSMFLGEIFPPKFSAKPFLNSNVITLKVEAEEDYCGLPPSEIFCFTFGNKHKLIKKEYLCYISDFEEANKNILKIQGIDTYPIFDFSNKLGVHIQDYIRSELNISLNNKNHHRIAKGKIETIDQYKRNDYLYKITNHFLENHVLPHFNIKIVGFSITETVFETWVEL